MNAQASGTRALVFDVFGTVVDWHGSVAREMRELAKARGLRLNAAKFAKAWRAGYRPAMDRVRSGEAPFEKIDAIHRATSSRCCGSSRSPRSPKKKRPTSTWSGTGSSPGPIRPGA